MEAQLFVSCPFSRLYEKYLPKVLENRLNVEIGLNCGALHRFSNSVFRQVARCLQETGLKALVHAPFSDLSLGALDPAVRRAVLDRHLQALEVAALFGARKMVLHTGFDKRHYWGQEERWLANAIESLLHISERADEYHIKMVVENVFEPDWRIHKTIFEAMGEEVQVGFCFDIGHHMVFSHAAQEEWLRYLGVWLSHCHLHDNLGRHDDHLAVGLGILDFQGLFRWLKKEAPPVLTLTIEAHREQDVMVSVERVNNYMAHI